MTAPGQALHMDLKNNYGMIQEYTCELTSFLDLEARLVTAKSSWFRHYVLDSPDVRPDGAKVYPIRVPGGTVGSLTLDQNRRVTAIGIDQDYVVKTYPADLDEKLKPFIGRTVHWPHDAA